MARDLAQRLAEDPDPLIAARAQEVLAASAGRGRLATGAKGRRPPVRVASGQPDDLIEQGAFGGTATARPEPPGRPGLNGPASWM